MENNKDLIDLVSKKYKGQKVLVNLEKGNDILTEAIAKVKNDIIIANEPFNSDKLNGEFEEIQARNFAK